MSGEKANVHFIGDGRGNIEQVSRVCPGCDDYGRRIGSNGTEVVSKNCTLDGCRGHLPHKIRISDEVLFGTPSGVVGHSVDAKGHRRGTR